MTENPQGLNSEQFNKIQAAVAEIHPDAMIFGMTRYYLPDGEDVVMVDYVIWGTFEPSTIMINSALEIV